MLGGSLVTAQMSVRGSRVGFEAEECKQGSKAKRQVDLRPHNHSHGSHTLQRLMTRVGRRVQDLAS